MNKYVNNIVYKLIIIFNFYYSFLLSISHFKYLIFIIHSYYL